MTHPFQRFVRSRCGFSLVEVALALGVVSFGLTAILGLMPVGFSRFHEAMDITVSSQIGSIVSSDLKQTPFATLVDPGAVFDPRFFSDQGVEVEAERDGIYTAIVTVAKGASIPSGVNNQNVARVSIEIKAHRGTTGQAATSGVIRRMTFLVADRG